MMKKRNKRHTCVFELPDILGDLLLRLVWLTLTFFVKQKWEEEEERRGDLNYCLRIVESVLILRIKCKIEIEIPLPKIAQNKNNPADLLNA